MLVELSLGSCNSILLAGGLSAALQLQDLFPGGPNFRAWSRLGSSSVGSHPFQSSKASSQHARGATDGSATTVVLCSIWKDAWTPGPYSELPARRLPSHHPHQLVRPTQHHPPCAQPPGRMGSLEAPTLQSCLAPCPVQVLLLQDGAPGVGTWASPAGRTGCPDCHQALLSHGEVQLR